MSIDKDDHTRQCQASDWRIHKQECKKDENWDPKHKCSECIVIHVKVRSVKKAEIKCCPHLDWECQKYHIGMKTRTDHDSMTVILDGKKMTSENYVELLTNRKNKGSTTKGMVIGVEVIEKGDLSEKEINHLMNITGASRNSAIKSLQENGSPVEALLKLTG